MPIDYSQIARENERKYGTEIDNYGPKLLADRYSDPAHFVFELLQNAEDAIGERVRSGKHSNLPKAAKFTLFKDRLEFRHFGIPFAENHIRAICDIARSSKQTTSGAIGHFGIGFKSVYAFTRSPEVHSCGESFAIESLVRPAPVAQKPTAEGETLFVLPFNHAETSSTESHGIIAERFRELGPRTLLFLRRLDEIDWQIDGGGFGRYLRETQQKAEGVEHITLIGEERGKATMEEHWLVFSRAVRGENDASGLVEIAYQLQPTKEARRHQIRRTKDSPLCVYFATDLQTNLGFLVQGPFHLTQNRDNIRREDKWNKALAKEVGKLTADSLSKLKELGLLSVSTLDAMPLEKEPFETETGKLFLPVYDAVLQTLKRHPLIPGMGKSFVSGMNGVLVRGRELADLFKPEQLKLLLGSDVERQWISPDITDKKSTQRLHFYLRDAVGVDEVDADTLVWRLDDSFLQEQKVDWFGRFYRFLLKHQSLWSEGGGLRDKSIIRLADGSNVSPFDSDGAANAFLPTEGETGSKTVHPKLARGDALTFFRKLGIRERDAVAEVLEDILPQYESGEAPAERKHERNLGRIFRALGDEKSPDHSVLVDKLRDVPFLRAENAKTGIQEFQAPSSLVYFKNSELNEYFNGQDDCCFLAEPSLSKKAKDLVAGLGVGELPALQEPPEEVKLRREQEIAPEQPRKREVECTDYHLHGLESVLKRVRKLCKASPKQAVRLSQIVWGILTRVADDEDGRFLRGSLKWKRPGARRAEEDTFDAYFVERLKEEAWLPNRKGQFRKPGEMQEQELPSGFERNRKLCAALSFQTPLAEKLKSVGITPKEAKFLEWARNNPQSADEILRRRATTPPVSASVSKELVVPDKPGAMDRIEAAKAPAGQSHSVPSRESEESGIPSGETLQARSEDVGEGADAFERKGERTPRTDHLQTRVRVAGGITNGSTPETQEMSESRTRIDKSGVAAVKAFEERAGRSVTEMPHNHPGYDLESRGQSAEVVRYIEVKSTGADWNGVLLSATQFQKAQELGEQYWLYVVENADSAVPTVYPIQNPAGIAEKFIFDNGWKVISTAQNTLH